MFECHTSISSEMVIDKIKKAGGMGHYKPNGQLSFIEIYEFSKPGTKDKFFSKKPSAMTAQQQLLFQLKQTKKSSSLNALKNASGLLKDEISEDQFNEIMKDLHR